MLRLRDEDDAGGPYPYALGVGQPAAPERAVLTPVPMYLDDREPMRVGIAYDLALRARRLAPNLVLRREAEVALR